MSRIYWDTMLFIYWIEEHPTHLDRIKRLLSRIEVRGDQLCSSTFGLGELLVGARQRNDQHLAEAIRTAMRPPCCNAHMRQVRARQPDSERRPGT